VRIRFYGADVSNFLKYAQEIVALAEFKETAENELELALDWCDDHAVTVGGPTRTEARMLYPLLYPRRVHTVEVQGDTFEAFSPPVNAGWMTQGCAVGGTVASDAPWVSGSCSCVSATGTPTSPGDCRVIDSDNDEHPGFTVRWTGGIEVDNYVARTDLSQIKLGKIDAVKKRHEAQYFWSHDHRPLTCASASCTEPPPSRKCQNAASVDKALFAPVERADFNCDAVLKKRNAGLLFLPEDLVPISDC
jgi:hypothetical protein